MPSYWGYEKRGIQKPGGVLWWYNNLMISAARMIKMSAQMNGSQTQTATSNSQMKKLIANLAGSQTQIGSLTAQQKKLVANLSGAQTQTGPIAVAMKQLVTALVGAQYQIGSLSATNKKMLSQMLGVMQPKGTIAVVEGLMSAQIVGAQTQIGAQSSDFQKMSAIITAAQIQSGALPVSLSKLSAALIGAQEQSGVLAATNQKLVANLTGAQEQYGSLAAVNQKMLTSMTATQTQSGLIIVSAGKMSANLVGAQVQTGALAVTEGQMSAQLNGVMQPQGVLSVAIAKLAVALSGAQAQTGALAAVNKKLLSSMIGTQVQTGTLAASNQKMSASITAGQSQIATIVASMKPLGTLIGGGEVKQTGVLGVAFQKMTSGASGVSTQEQEYGPLTAEFKPLSTSMIGALIQSGSLGCTLGGMSAQLGAFSIDPIQLVGTATAETNNIAIPGSYQADDLILLFVYRESATFYTAAAGWTPLKTSTGNTQSGGLYYKWATSGSETSGTWTNATAMVCMVYRGVSAIGASTIQNAVSATVNFQALTFMNIDTNPGAYSTVVAMAAHRSVNGTYSGAPAGMVNRVVREGSASDLGGWDTNGGVGFLVGQNYAYGGTSSGYITAEVELLPQTVNVYENITIYKKIVPPGKSAKMSMLGGGGSGGAAATRNSSTRPSGYGGAGAGGGAWVQDLIIPPELLGATCSFIRGMGGAGQPTTSQNGNDGGDTVFSSNGYSAIAGGGKAGNRPISSGVQAIPGVGGAPSTDFPYYTIAGYENGGVGGYGSITAAEPANATAPNTIHAGAGGGGGGCNISTAGNGGDGGSSANAAGGVNGIPGGTGGNAPAGEGGGGGGGGNASSGSGTAGLGGPGGSYGAGSGGGGGKEGAFSGAANGSDDGYPGYNRLEFV